MKKNKILSVAGVLTLIIPLLFGLIPEQVEATDGIYYVDAASGDDGNTGTSPDQAWKTLDKVEQTKFEPGDTIRLHEESVFEDSLYLEGDVNGEGAEGAPIILESYGDTGGKARIDGNGGALIPAITSQKYQSTVTLYNASHWTIRNLEITNIKEGENPEIEKSFDNRVGLYVLAKGNGLTQDIHVDDVYVHDVNGHVHKKDTGNGGIFFTVTGTPAGEPTRFHNISVTNCNVENVTRTGISVGATTYADLVTHETEVYTIEEEKIKEFGHTEVLIENNRVFRSGGDAIVPQLCHRPLIQYNVSDEASYSHAKWPELGLRGDDWQVNAGIWPWLCYYPNFQFNEAYNTYDNYDGEGYDCDSGTGTIYQYNYSHDNEGGFMLICSGKNFNSLIRYNISENDRKHLFLASNNTTPDDPKWPNVPMKDIARVHNNTFYTGEGIDVAPMNQNEFGYIKMKNNIFYNEGTNTSPNWQPAKYGESVGETVYYDSNLYYGYTNAPENDKNPVVVKDSAEIMEAPGTGGVGLDSVSGYQLTSSSPAINKGVTIADAEDQSVIESNNRDYFGNALTDGQTDIGAHEYAGEITPPTSSTESSSTESSSSSTESSSTESSTSSTESSSTESSSSSTEESSSTKPSSSSTEESSSTKPSSSSTEESSSTKPSSSSTEESSSTKPSSSSTEESSSTKPSSSSTEESSSTKPSSSSTEESSSTKPSSSSTEESSSTKPSSSSTEESSSTKPSSSSTEESSSTKPSSSSTEESSSTKPSSSSKEESSSTKPSSSSTEESSSTKPSSSSTEESSSTKPSSSSTEESSSTKPSSSSTEESSSTKPSSSSTEESSSTKPSSSSTEESSSTKPSSSSTEESSSTKPTSSSTEESSSTKPSSNSTEESSDSTEESTSSTKDSSDKNKDKDTDKDKDKDTNKDKDAEKDKEKNSDKKQPTNDSKGNLTANGSPNKPNGGGGTKTGNVSVQNYAVNGAAESTKKELPKTGNSNNHLLIWFGILLIIGSTVLIRKTNLVRK